MADKVPAPNISVPVTQIETGVITTPEGKKKEPRGFAISASPKLIVGVIITSAVVLFALIAPFFTRSPRDSSGPSLQEPGGDYLLGTTNLGRDVLAQLAHGGRGTLLVGLVVGVIALVFSLIFGIVAGYFGKAVDEILSFVTNVMLVIPGLPLVIVISAYVQNRSVMMVALVLGITSWAGAAIVLRAQARSLRNRDYVAAARVAGESPWRIILVEILPNLLPLVAAQFIGAFIAAMLGEAGLSYLGLGPTGSITWGTMLNEAQSGFALIRGAWWWFIPPGLLIALMGAGLSLINFAIDEIINPKLRLGPEAERAVREADQAKKQRQKDRRKASKTQVNTVQAPEDNL